MIHGEPDAVEFDLEQLPVHLDSVRRLAGYTEQVRVVVAEDNVNGSWILRELVHDKGGAQVAAMQEHFGFGGQVGQCRLQVMKMVVSVGDDADAHGFIVEVPRATFVQRQPPASEEFSRMPLLTWKPEYTVGNRDIDAQHQYLIELVNELHDRMSTGERADTLEPLLSALIRFVAAHFAAEERHMQACRFHGYTQQRLENQALAEQLNRFVSDFRARRDAAALQLSTFLKYSMHDHMSVADQAYPRHWRSQGSRPELRVQC
jgi:hemerythrin